MKYLLMMYGDERVWDDSTPAEREAWFGMHDAFDAAVRDRGAMLGGEALATADTATTVRPADSAGVRPVTEGPFAEAVEQLGGFYLVELADLDTMIELCELLPSYYHLEIRPVVEL